MAGSPNGSGSGSEGSQPTGFGVQSAPKVASAVPRRASAGKVTPAAVAAALAAAAPAAAKRAPAVKVAPAAVAPASQTQVFTLSQGQVVNSEEFEA